LIAAINAVKMVSGEEPLVLDRSQAYIGVLIDDLVTCGTKEPYRLFTSRAEYRLLLREDNADLRLTEIGHQLGLVADDSYQRFLSKKEAIEKGIEWLKGTTLKPTREVNQRFESIGSASLKQQTDLAAVLRRPEIDHQKLALVYGGELQVDEACREDVQLQVKYDGYIKRQQEQVDRFRKFESITLPEDIEYSSMPGLSAEVVEKLSRVRPLNLGQASRISGITPAAISILQVHLKKSGLL
jgi:tRNA uridine 5-carboxymethylaminomethyl modification enzyme